MKNLIGIHVSFLYLPFLNSQFSILNSVGGRYCGRRRLRVLAISPL
jgi:hypothetical protein